MSGNVVGEAILIELGAPEHRHGLAGSGVGRVQYSCQLPPLVAKEKPTTTRVFTVGR